MSYTTQENKNKNKGDLVLQIRIVVIIGAWWWRWWWYFAGFLFFKNVFKEKKKSPISDAFEMNSIKKAIVFRLYVDKHFCIQYACCFSSSSCSFGLMKNEIQSTVSVLYHTYLYILGNILLILRCCCTQ